MIITNVLRNKIHDEFLTSGILISYVGAVEGNNPIGAIIDFAEGTDMDLVQQIIDAHDPTPLPEPLNEIDKLKISQAEQFETILELLGGMM